MAKNLNKSRIRDSKAVLFFVLLVVLFTKAFIKDDTIFHEAIEFVGYFLVSLCAIGRVYSTAFLGGFKNQTLITYGAFSVVRNPLYVFSLIGMTGVAFLSTHIVIIVFLPSFFLVLYHFLVRREEEFLAHEFGQDYEDYKSRVPRFIPNFRLYNAPDNISVAPKYLNKAFKDAVWWFLAFPVFEAIEYLHHIGLIKPLFMVP